MIGSELGGRYDILARIGGGGMAVVYKAHDQVLNRKVAIKVLRNQYVHDDDFIRRFRREAQSAGALSHPNVVSVYDVGQEGDTHYMVMELVEGTNLNEKIKEQAPLQTEEAVNIAIQICDALDHAHSNQIIHRDIKPHNILIGNNGRVKVTDFGIARAVSSSDITQTGAVLGSVHYFSPEHAKGISQGEKSDIYSLGIVLYQMLTGKLPFLGESPISVALKHLQENFEEPRLVNRLIPQSVENIIMKAMRKNPQERYLSAREMLRDLETCLSPARQYEAKIIFDDDHHADGDNTIIIPAIKPESYSSKASMEDTRSFNEKPSKRKSWVKPTIIASSIILVLVLMWLAILFVKNQLNVPEVEVPNVVELSLDEAIEQLEDAGLKADPIEYKYHDEISIDHVIDQSKKNLRVNEGSSIKLTVSKGPSLVKMSNYIGLQWEDVERELLETFRSNQIKLEEVFNSEAEGTVVKQLPRANEEVDLENGEITITVSKGKGTFKMPNLVGLEEAEAIRVIEENNLLLEPISYEASFTPKGYVFKQWPYEAGTMVDPESKITIFVSSGLPDETVEVIESVYVEPTEEGVSTSITILISDVFGQNREWGSREITEAVSLPVSITVSSTANAVISVYRNNKLYDSWTVTYKDAVKDQRPTE